MNEPRLFIATPLRGGGYISVEHHTSIVRLLGATNVTRAYLATNDDLTRARSRIARVFLEDPKNTHLLFWDDDVAPRNLHAIDAMIASGLDVVALPYPRKKISWESVEAAARDEEEMTRLGRMGAAEIEQGAYSYPIRTGERRQVESIQIGDDVVPVIEVDGAPTGFMMIRRHVIERMIDAYPELMFKDIDTNGGAPKMTCALFMLHLDQTSRDLMHEDHSFCWRWRKLGGKVYIWVDGANHVGSHVYRGDPRGLVDPQV